MKQLGVISQPAFNYQEHLLELKERFSRLIHSLGNKNERGTLRYTYEVEFMYALNELEMGPIYLRGKLFERANEVINRLLSHIRSRAPAEEAAAP